MPFSVATMISSGTGFGVGCWGENRNDGEWWLGGEVVAMSVSTSSLGRSWPMQRRWRVGEGAYNSYRYRLEEEESFPHDVHAET